MIVPALLTDTKSELERMSKICSQFTDFVQIDIMDGEFVPSKSITLADISGWKSSIGCEAHLMVSDPQAWIVPFKDFGANRIIYHYEIEKDHQQIIKDIKKENLGAGLAINPDTEIKEFHHLVKDLDVILFMSVYPGFYGAEFVPRVLDKIKNFRKEFPQIEISIDGGMKKSNCLAARQAGANCICVGSAILKSPDPKASFLEFEKILKNNPAPNL